MSSATLPLLLADSRDADHGWPDEHGMPPPAGPWGEPPTDGGAEPVRPARAQEREQSPTPHPGVRVGHGRPARTLNDQLLSLLRGDLRDCVVCGEPAAIEATRVTCPACGSAIEERPSDAADQLAMI
jgi:predicted RNA-binding Zn-ribbon protein involved in translation (DUF1610 family)